MLCKGKYESDSEVFSMYNVLNEALSKPDGDYILPSVIKAHDVPRFDTVRNKGVSRSE